MGNDLKSWQVRISVPSIDIVISPRSDSPSVADFAQLPISMYIDQEGRIRQADSGQEVRGYKKVTSVGATTNTYCNGGGPESTNLHCKNTTGTNTYCCDAPDGTNEFCCDD